METNASGASPDPASAEGAAPDGLQNAEPKLLGSTAAKIRLAAASILVLALGFAVAPPRARTFTPSEERAAPLLTQEVLRRETSTPTIGGIAETAARVGNHVVAIREIVREPPRTLRDHVAAASPAGRPGLAVTMNASGDLVAHAAALEGRTTVQFRTAAGDELTARAVTDDPDSGFVLLRTTTPAAFEVPSLAPAPAAPGALGAAVARWRGQRYVQPVFITSHESGLYTFTSGAAIYPGTPIYDLEGRLLAIAVGATRPGEARAAGELFARLRARDTAKRGLEPSLGLAVQPIDEQLSSLTGPGATIVSDVVPDGPAAAADVRVGDIILQIDSTDVRSADDFLAAIRRLTPGAEAVLRLRRDRVERRIAIAVGTALEVTALQRRNPTGAGDAPELRELFPNHQKNGGRLPAGVRVLRINGQPVQSLAQARAQMRRTPGPWLLYLQDGQERFFAVAGTAAESKE